MDPIRITFDQGTLLLEGPELPRSDCERLGLVPDERVQAWRAEACRYRSIIEHLHAAGIPCEDKARAYDVITDLAFRPPFAPYRHQKEALAAWQENGCLGVVVLPTGSGKTYVAHMAIAHCRRSTLVVVPTLDLVTQWVQALERDFATRAGIVGGGEFTVRPLTVITYDSAARHMESLGNRFGLIVFDECHHLPGPVYSMIARMSLAPFRLGLTATPERADRGHELLEGLIGPVASRARVSALAGNVLSPYTTRRIPVDLSPAEQEAYAAARNVYLDFCRRHGIRMSATDGWHTFLQQTARSKEGRTAFEAYLTQRDIPLKSESKFRELAGLLLVHRRDRIILFTHVNEMAYRVSATFLLPIITHQTPPRERVDILRKFGTGEYPALVTSKVLNEGVDVPEANVGIVMSGSGSVREHVQRLGRILRKREGKEAVLYELISRGTHEERMSQRRRQHEAYRRRHA